MRSGFVTNEALDVLEFLGDTSPYLRFMPGQAVLNLRRIAMPPLYREVLATVKKTAKTRVVRRSGVPVLLGTERKKIDIEVARLKNYSAGEICYRILLEQVVPRSGKGAKTKREPKTEQAEDPEAARLKQELADTRESFGAILAEQDREYRAAQRGLKVANEELQATAARLEVTNAELESSQAELEETAEELRVALAASEQHGQESEGRVRALLETAAQGILAVERSGRIGLVNGTAEKMFGYGREELLGRPVEMLLPDNFRSAHRRHRREFFAHPRTRPMGQGLDLFARRKDGATFPVEISLSHIEPEGDIVAVAFISDITERKRAEESLCESEERFRHVADSAPVLIWISGPDKKCTWFNQPWLDFTGRSMEQELGDGWTEGVHPKDINRCLSTYSRAFDAREPFTMDYRLRRADGQYRWVLDTGIPQLVGTEFTGYIGSCLDITERKVAEQELREEHAFNSALVEIVHALVVVLDREGRIVRFNKACQEITGYSFEEVQDRRVWEFLLVPEEVEPVKRVFRKLKAGHFPNQFENYWVTKAGQRRLISWSNTVLLRSSGTVSFVIGTGLDITAQRQMEETIRESHDELRQLTARLISAQEGVYKHLSRELHDVFSQKLAMLGMHVSELERKLSAGVSTEEGLGPVGEQISSLASEIHGISRRLHPAILDDLGLAVALKNECLAFSREHGIEVKFHAESVPISLSGDVALCLYRIAQESLNNIQKHAETNEARVTLTGDPGEIVLSIEDFGKGFDPNEVRGKGGLGLVSMEERVRLVDGELTIQSKPGDGATIQVRVPLKKPGRRRAKQ
ncbi:MAG: PAS domain S-box protein [Acidobacteria bacterium]|nr:PAS domain S-box protein [Acidobacteriota bacterium]